MPTNRRIMPDDGYQFYPTPEWATKALLDRESFHGKIWEPCAGNGDMVRPIAEKYGRSNVIASDIVERDFRLDFVGDIFDNSRNSEFTDHLITNPPYGRDIDRLVLAGLRQTKYKMALLLRLAFMESERRYNTLFSNPETRPKRVHVFSERITFYPGGVRTAGSGTTAYAWFVFDKSEEEKFKPTTIQWIEPGYKK